MLCDWMSDAAGDDRDGYQAINHISVLDVLQSHTQAESGKVLIT